MKLCLIGGGGTRAPLFVQAVAHRSAQLPISEIALWDADADRLCLYGGLAAAFARHAAAPFSVSLARSLDEAIEGASFAITSIRAGGDAGRVRDERIALDHGVLGQETVGAGGFGLAMRNAPALLEIAETLRAREPLAWTLHFTNPAGLVAQILHDAGFTRNIGICDTPADMVRRSAAFLGVEPRTVRATVVGLNHLSWLTSFTSESGAEELQRLLADSRFLNEVAAPFEPDLVRGLGFLPSEYLHYYYHRDQALARQLARPHSRGSVLEARNRRLTETLRALDPAGRYDSCLVQAIAAYQSYTRDRDETYRDELGRFDAPPPLHDPSEGYAGIALDLISAITNGGGHAIVASVPNRGAVLGLESDDVVEITSTVDQGGPVPLPVGRLPDEVSSLVQSVKTYERLASRAILQHDAKLAGRALTAHPLIGSFPLATTLVSRYLDAHAAHLPHYR